MNKLYRVPMAGLALLAAGCTTSSKVQQMIDASHRDYSSTVQKHEDSIEVLKKSSMAGLEQGKRNTDAVADLRRKLDELQNEMRTIRVSLDAAAIQNADNTLKVAELERTVRANKTLLDEAVVRMDGIDQLHARVLLGHFQALAESASAATDALKYDGAAIPVPARALDKPLEIVAPDTSAPPAVVAE